MTKTRLSGLNSLHVELFNHIRNYFPERMADSKELEEFILTRSDRANKRYVSMLEQGYDVQQAEEEAYSILYEGLNFSPAEYIQSCIMEAFDEELNINELLDYIKEFKEFFDKVPDDIDSYPEADLLRQKIIDRYRNESEGKVKKEH